MKAGLASGPLSVLTFRCKGYEPNDPESQGKLPKGRRERCALKTKWRTWPYKKRDLKRVTIAQRPFRAFAPMSQPVGLIP